MLQTDTNQSSLPSTPSYPIDQLRNIQPRLCILHKWSGYDGYGLHLGRCEHWLGLRIANVEPNSPAESAGLLREDIVLAINGRFIENNDFFTILSFIEHELEQDQIRFLVLDPDSAELARRYQMNISENNDNCIQIEATQFRENPEKILNNSEQTMAQNPSPNGVNDTHKSSSDSGPNINLKTETRLCPVILSSNTDIIGISIQSDNDFGHIIMHVEPNSAADRAGIKTDDCIISVNNIVLIYKPFEDVLYFLKKSRHQSRLNFLLAKKSYLLQTSPNHSSSQSNIVQRNRSSTLPMTETREPLYQQYNHEQSTRNQKRDTIISITDEQYDTLSLQIYNNRYPTKHKKGHGKILRGIGPATAHRYSWSVASEKTVDYSSVTYDLYDRTPVVEEPKQRRSIIKTVFKSLQVGMTNPSPKQPPRRIPAHNRTVSFSENEQHIVQSPTSVARQNHSPKVLRSPTLTVSSNQAVKTPSPILKHTQTIDNIVNATPITPVQLSPIMRIRKQDNSRNLQTSLRLEMNVPNKSAKNPPTLPVHCDTDDDYFSAVSVKSHEDELANPKTSHSNANESTDDKKEETFFETTNSDNESNLTVISKNLDSVNPTQHAEQTNNESSDSTFETHDENAEKQDQTISQSNTNSQEELNLMDETLNKQHIETPLPSAEMAIATIPISELPNNGYELHDIKLQQASESIPVGFKLTKQTDPLQYLITVVIEESKADLAGLKVDDWIIKLEDNDVRLIDLHDISQDIHQLLNTQGHINMLIARRRPTTLSLLVDDSRVSAVTSYDLPSEKNIHLSVGLSNRIEEENLHHLTGDGYATIQYESINKDKIRHVTLKEVSGLYFDSFIPDNNSPTQLHFIKNIQPISIAYKAGLRNNDRILNVNSIDVTKTAHENVRSMILDKQPVELTVINDPKNFELIEKYKSNQNRMTFSSLIYESIEQQSNNLSKDLANVLFIDDHGPVYMKHCVIQKDPQYNILGFLLHYIEKVHTVGSVDTNYPAYHNGLRDDDAILFINNKNIEQMTHNDVTTLLRSLVQSNQTVDLILISKNDVKRYKNYKNKSFIDWKNILADINEDDATNDQHIYVNHSLPSSLLTGARVCVLETSPNCSAGFTISGREPAPFAICKIEKDSPADKAGLQLNDSLISINGRSVTGTNYEQTIQIIKEELGQKTIQFIVNQVPMSKDIRNHSSTSDSDGTQGIDGTKQRQDSSERGGNAVHAYQRQRNKELSYTLRLCHLNATTRDGKPPSTFGFEISEDPNYDYPIVSRVEPKLAGDCAGLQTHDILIKVNDRKTKGLDFDKIKKLIEKARRDGRLEMLVVDKDTYNYCIRTNKKFKQSYIKIKHIFPRRTSTKHFQKLPLIAKSSRDGNSFDAERMLMHEEIICENDLNPPLFDENDDANASAPVGVSNTTHTFFPYGVSPASIDPERWDTNSPIPKIPDTTEESIIDVILAAINNFFQNFTIEKPNHQDYDVPCGRASKSPVSPTVRFHESVSERVRHVSQTYTIHSNHSGGLYDYIRDTRRCVLNIDREKGLGFVLSATDDYDHRITGIDENSIAEAGGLHINDEIVEINGINVRNIKYEEVVDMLISAMRKDDKIELCVINGRLSAVSPSILHTKNKKTNIDGLLNNNSITAKNTADDHSDKNSLDNQSKYANNTIDRDFSEKILAYSTGITASPKDLRAVKTGSNSLKKDLTKKILNIGKKDAPVARLCRVRKFPSSPFYGFFLCGNPKELGGIYVSNIAKNSSASICGLRDGDHIIEVNGTNIQKLTYETILNKIKSHMEQQDLELLVLDKKSVRWYRERDYPITSQTLPTILHIEPIINDIKSKIQPSPALDRPSEPDDYTDRRISTTTL